MAWLRTSAFLGLLGATVIASGCAAERDPISRVQANVLNKHFFVGPDLSDRSDDPEFYWRNYVVDASASQSMIGVGSWGGIDRIHWEVTENFLVARKSYQIAFGQDDKADGGAREGASSNGASGDVAGTDPYGNKLVKSQNGTVVAVYPIQSHFDIRRSYNAQTGEELNIVEENSSDRPWSQREYMRVDWSKNMVDNPMWEEMFLGKVFGNLEVTPVAYAVTDPRHEDAPRIDEADGYLEITNKYWVGPAQSASPFTDLDGTVPTCVIIGLFTGSATYECDAQEAVVRHSYWRIDPNHDFEPLENTKANLDVIGNPGGLGNSYIVGIVSAGRQGWDPQYGYTDQLFHRFAHRHNVWKKSHQAVKCDANDDVDENGTADQCENDLTGYGGSTGSQCDVFTKKCTIPYRDREIKTVGYWINKETPDALLDPVPPDSLTPPDNVTVPNGSLEDLVRSWNQLMKVGLAYAREVECRRTGSGDRDQCHSDFFESTQDPATKEMVSFGGWLVDKPRDKTPALTFCHNPVRAYDLTEVCGRIGDRARVGDVRKNFIFYWPYESRAPWGGIANWNADPLTGEIIGGAAQIMGRSATYAASLNRDVIQLALGDISMSEIIQGVPTQVYSKLLTNGFAPMGLSAEEQKARIGAVDQLHVKQTVPFAPLGGSPMDQQMAQLKIAARTSNDPTLYGNTLFQWNAVASKLRGTQQEAALVDPSWLVNAIGASPQTSITNAVLEQASLLRGLDPGRLAAMQDLYTQLLHARGACYLENEAPAAGSVLVPSVAPYFGRKYANLDKVERGKKIYEDLWKETVKGIGLHEIGHSLGMLHQFASSWDAANYNPQYWQLRTNEGQSTANCAGVPRDPMAPDSCMGPRYDDPETPDELGTTAEEPRPNIQYFGNTSTMEYQLERFGETVGLGTYDLHTMKALYGGVLESVDERVIPSARDRQKAGWRSFSQLIDRDLYDGNFRHYTEFARLMKVFDPNRDCRPATEAEKKTGEWRIVHGKVCAPAPRDHWKWSDFKSSDYMVFNGRPCDPANNSCSDVAGPYWHTTTRTPGANKEFVRWNYKWGVSNNAYFHTNPSDGGADSYEVTQNTIRRFDTTYPWQYFRRQNREYYYRGISSRIMSSYLDRIRSYHWNVASGLARSRPQDLDSDDNMKPEIMAQADMIQYLLRVITMPEPGGYQSSDNNATVAPRRSPGQVRAIWDTPGQSSGAFFDIGITSGRFIQEDYSNVEGGSWDYLHWLNHTGFEVEKTYAMLALLDSRPTLFTISRDNALDGRAVMINFRNDLPQAVDRIVGAVLANDWEMISPWVPNGGTQQQMELEPIQVDVAKGFTRPADARVLFPNIGYKQQVNAAVVAGIFGKMNSDMTLMNKMRVWVEGQVGGVTIPDSQQIRFTNPDNGYTYVARKYGRETIDGKSVETGVASRMLEQANATLAAIYEVQLDGANQPIYDAYGRPALVLDGNGQPVQKASTFSKGDLDRYVSLIEGVKQIGAILGFGPL